MEWNPQALPRQGLTLLSLLEQAGYEACFVGGCVRDLLLGTPPQDWDICTSARPEEMKKVFSQCKVWDTGIRHGTLLVQMEGRNFEVTTYRAESGYLDHRRPDQVRFVTSLTQDLARRDFTINAMACHPRRGLVDPFGGQQDLEAGLVRAVGDPAARFGEDALRMLRALRFAGRFSFSLEPNTARAVQDHRQDLALLAVERVFLELKAILVTPAAGALLREFRDVFAVVLPELEPLFDYDQRNPHHCYDAWEHTLRVVDGVPATVPLRLAALFHDTGKPECRRVDEQGIAHYYGHEAKSAELARQALLRLKSDNATRRRVERLISLHGRNLPQTSKTMRRWLTQYPPDLWEDMVLLRRADGRASSPAGVGENEAYLDAFLARMHAELEGSPCLSQNQLAVNGGDLAALGIPRGPEMGVWLKRAFAAVVDGKVENDREALLCWIAKQRGGKGQTPG